MYSRRDFGKAAFAGLAMSTALAKISSTVNGVRLGVQTYSFREFPHDGIVDAIIKAMVGVGLGECEIYSPQLEPASAAPAGGGRGAQNDPVRLKAREDLRNWRLTVPLDYFRSVRKKFDQAGIGIFAYNLSFNDSFTDQEIDRGFEMAKALRARILTASTTVSVAKRVAPFAEKHKMTVAMHSNPNGADPNQFAGPESFQKAIAMSKYFAVNLDIAHFMAAGYDPVEYLQSHHDHVVLLHVKDRKKAGGVNCPWGEGDVPIKPVLSLLKEKKYPIPAFIEYEYRGAGSAEAELKKCFQYCREALA
jgi:sugar phosphate isomerase/epimerase